VTSADEANALDALASGGTRSLDAFLRPRVRHLRSVFASSGDPRAVYNPSRRLVEVVGPLPASSASYQYSRLLALIAELLIAEGKDISSLMEAEHTLVSAIDILHLIPVISTDILSAHVSYALHLTVARKALGQFEAAVRGLSESKTRLQSRMGLTELDVLMLERQEVIMQQDLGAYRRLAEKSAIYVRERPIEYYATLKRIFEFSLNQGMIDEAVALSSEFQRSFLAVKTRLPLLSHLSFSKNMGHYLLHKGQSEKAIGVLDLCLRSSEALNFQGQRRQILHLLNQSSSQSRRALPTFRVV
jgi:hypothetical protein